MNIPRDDSQQINGVVFKVVLELTRVILHKNWLPADFMELCEIVEEICDEFIAQVIEFIQFLNGLIGVQAIPLLHKGIEEVLGQDHVALLNNLKTESQFHIFWVDRPAHILPINLRKSRFGVRRAHFRVIGHAGVVLRDGVIKIHAPLVILEV